MSQKHLLGILKQLSKHNTALRKCLKTNMIMRKLKCRVQLYQKTRWTGALNILFSVKRAYEKGAFDYDGLDCPIELETIEAYIQVLLPALKITLNWEKNNTSIGEVVPAVHWLIESWDKMVVREKQVQELCFFLIHFVRKKFNYEIESNQIFMQ